MIKCKDKECPFKCLRYSETAEEYFSPSPRKGDTCNMKWTEKTQAIMEQLMGVVNIKTK
jgi:hypothetical protein